MPDATGLELIARELRDAPEGGDRVLDTVFFRNRATLIVTPDGIRPALELLHAKGFTFLSSVHGVDYFPEEPRLGVQYELLDMKEVDRITVKLRVPTDAPTVPSVTKEWPTADHQEREVYDMFGVLFDGHPDHRRRRRSSARRPDRSRPTRRPPRCRGRRSACASPGQGATGSRRAA